MSGLADRSHWTESGYGRELAIRIDEDEVDRVRVRVPFREELANPGGALHGGVMASAIDLAASMAAAIAPQDAADFESGALELSVNFLAAAIREDIIATAEVLRRGKEITFCQVAVGNDAGKRIASGSVTHRCVPRMVTAAEPARRRAATPAAAFSGPLIPGAEAFVSFGFMARLGLAVTSTVGGEAQVTMADLPELMDDQGCLHEGAIAAAIDSTGALASWSIVGFNPSYKASTVGLQINFAGPARGPLLVQARVRRRREEIFLSQVEVSEIGSRQMVAIGTVTYRIVVPQ